MADNILTPLVDITLATKNIGGVQFQKGMLTTENGNVVNDANPLPVKVSSDTAINPTITIEQLASFTPEMVTAVTLDVLSKLSPAQIGALQFPTSFNMLKASSSTLTTTSATTSATAGNIATENTARKRLMIFNDSSANLYLSFGAVATVSSYSLKALPQQTVNVDWTTQAISGVWDSANGQARVTSFV